MTEITAQNLLTRGYAEFPGTAEGELRFFQKCVRDIHSDKKYFIEFREWSHADIGTTFDSRICCETDTGGYFWGTFREESIEVAESRAEVLWVATGSVFYEKISS